MLRRRSGGRDARHQLGVRPPRLRVGDLLREAAVSVGRHPARSLMTALGTVLAGAAFVATLGLGSTMSQQVSSSFDVRRATEVIVRPEETGLDPAWQQQAALDRLGRLNGVEAAGRRVALGEVQITRAPGVPGQRLQVIGADPRALDVMLPHLLAGRRYDAFHERNGVHTVLLSGSAADSLDITRTGVAVFIDDQAYTVIGIFDDVERRPEALLSVLIPASAADRLAAGASEQVDRDVVISTAPGAAQLIGRQAPLALWPASPTSLRAIAPPDPRTLRQEIETNVARSSLLLSVIALVIGAVSIGNAATAAISARTAEIGLRRAIGGRRLHIFAQLLAESTVLGGLGGVVGAMLGLAVIAGVSLWQGWQPVVDVRASLLATAVGAAAGLLAGLLPAARAMRVQPVAALQR